MNRGRGSGIIARTDGTQRFLTEGDLEDAVAAGVLGREDATRLMAWKLDRLATPPAIAALPRETEKGFNSVSVAYYIGALLMISACGWFLGDKWKELGSSGVLVTTLVYMAIAAVVGTRLRRSDFPVAGGLLVTVAVSLTPLIVWAIEDLTGLWLGAHPGAYKNYFPWIHGSWIVMELATIAVAAAALTRVRFAFLTAPIAFSFWFLSMDLAGLLLGKEHLGNEEAKWVSVIVGGITLLTGYGIDRMFHHAGEPKSEDFAFWCYLFGLFAFWGGLTSMNSNSEVGKAFYCIINIGFVALSLYLRRVTFLVFGVLGVHIYLGHLAYEIFKDSFLFPFVLAGLGLSVILVTVWAQKRMRQRLHDYGALAG